MMSEDSAQECTGLSARDFEGGGIQDLTIAEEFWLAMARNNRTSAKQIVAWLEFPPVVILAYLFELIKSKEGQVVDPEACQQEEGSA
jgi:hypothetical protein